MPPADPRPPPYLTRCEEEHAVGAVVEEHGARDGTRVDVAVPQVRAANRAGDVHAVREGRISTAVIQRVIVSGMCVCERELESDRGERREREREREIWRACDTHMTTQQLVRLPSRTSCPSVS
jgi:predicted NBD/HSP70 family sugar kinase